MPGQPSQSVIHCALRAYPEEVARHQPRTGHTHRKPEQMNSVPSPVVGAPTGVHSPQCCAPRRRWLRDFKVPEHSLMHSDGPHPTPVQSLDGKSCYIEVSRGDIFLAPQVYTPSQFNGTDLRKDLFAYMNGGSPNPRGLYPSSNQSLEHSTASQVSEVGFHSDYGHNNGYLNGLLNGDPNGHLHLKGNISGSLMPDTTNGKMSKEVPDSADIPSSNQRFQNRSRTQHARELLLGPGLGFNSGPSKLKKEGQTYLGGVCQSTQGKVEPKRFHRTLKNDLEVLHKASKIHQSSMELKGYLEVAIEDPVSELNKLTGNRHRQVKAQKLKRRNIPR
ncbi:uncharacterized protein LOC130120380 [Lampris incognitus]|uniref:uncharacterized protein LOC130120380 n=1 Tax=Lampris incognitus TaxID=2546036 RepID=UPI0024B51E6B|nr:uncharacterized protein LOC130120380 [Lampris incognitus]